MHVRSLLFTILGAILFLVAACQGDGAVTHPTFTPSAAMATSPPATQALNTPSGPTATTPPPSPNLTPDVQGHSGGTPTAAPRAAHTNRLIELEDSQGILYLKYPAALTQVQTQIDEQDKSYGYMLASPDGEEQLVVGVLIAQEMPLDDEAWQRQGENLTRAFAALLGQESMASAPKTIDARTLYLEQAADGTYGIFFAQEKSGVIGYLFWTMPQATWENQREDVTKSVIASFVWDPYDARVFFDDIITHRDPAGLFSLPLPAHMTDVETVDEHPMYGMMARSQKTGERLGFLLFDARTEELDDLFFDTLNRLEVGVFGQPVRAEAETTYDAQRFLVTFTEPFDSADGTMRGVEAIWEPQQGVRALFFWLAPAHVFTKEDVGNGVTPLFFHIQWDPARAAAYFAAHENASSRPSPTAIASPSPQTRTPRPAISAENLTSLQPLGRVSLEGSPDDLAWVSQDTMLAVVAAGRLHFYNQDLARIGPRQEVPAIFLAFSPDDEVAYLISQDDKDPLGDYTVIARPLDYLDSPNRSAEMAGRLDVPAWTTKLSGLAGVFAFDLSPDGRWLAVAEGHASVHLLDAQTGEVKAVFTMPYQGPHAPLILDIDFSPDSTLLGAVAYGGTFHVWRVADGSDVVHGRASLFSSEPAFLFATNQRFYLGGSMQVVEQTLEGKEMNRWSIEGTVDEMALNGDGSLLVIATGSEVLFVERASGEVMHRIPGSAPLAFRADHTLLAVTDGQQPSASEVVIYGVRP